MSYPVGLATKQVSFGQAVVMESGVALGMRVTITASRSLVYRPTGQPLVQQSTMFTADQPAGTRILTLPICDSTDMGTGNGQAISITGDQVTHTYMARIEYLSPTGGTLPGASGSRLVGPFVLRTSDPATVDLDDMILAEPGGPSEGIPVYIPPGGGTSDITELVGDTVDSGAPYRLILFEDGTVRAIPASTVDPTPPTGLAVEAHLSSVRLTWAAATAPTSGRTYVVYRDGVQIGTTAGLSFRDISIASGATYSYRVRTQDAYGQQSSLTSPVSAFIDPATNSAPAVTVTSWPLAAPTNGRTLLRVAASDVDAQSLALTLGVDDGTIVPTDDPSVWIYTSAGA